MICYAARTGTRRNLEVLRRAGWGLMVSRAGVWRREGFERVAIDNGAWSDYQAGRPFDGDAFERFLDWLEAQACAPDFIVLPDIVAGGMESLALSVRYFNRCGSLASRVLIPVQDGMEHADLTPLVGPNIGIFLGGSTAWKLARMEDWGQFCAERGVYYHVGRVNTRGRMYQAISAGAHSVDGSSVSRYAVTINSLDHARRHLDLFAPRAA